MINGKGFGIEKKLRLNYPYCQLPVPSWTCGAHDQVYGGSDPPGKINFKKCVIRIDLSHYGINYYSSKVETDKNVAVHEVRRIILLVKTLNRDLKSDYDEENNLNQDRNIFYLPNRSSPPRSILFRWSLQRPEETKIRSFFT